MSIFVGAGVAITTPFNEDGSVNYKEYERHINWLIENNADAIVTCGTTGESSTLTEEEHSEVVQFCIRVVNKRVPVIAGTGSNSTATAIKLSVEAENAGADALLLVTPYYNKTTQKGLIAHFTAIAESVKIPIILYNVASRTGINILPETVFELSKVENIAAIKEASGSIDQAMEIVALCGDNIDLYTGNDNQILPTMALGGKGVITVIGNIMPKETHDMVMNFLEGNVKESLDMQLKMLPFIKELFREVNPTPIKEALNSFGFPAGPCRLPLVPLEEENKEKLKKAMIDIGLL